MALEGNLNAFGLSEILQLIAVQQKSGMLSVNSEHGSMVVFFRNGHLVSTRDRRRRSIDPLKNYLLRYGILSQSDLMRIMNICTKSKLDMMEVIVSEDYMSEEEMRKHHRNQIQETIHEILTWEQCSYKFIPSEEILRDLVNWGECNVEGILMESMRRIDEFPQMLKEFPNPSIVILRTDKEADDELTANEQTVLGLLTDERTLSYVISQGKLPKFEIYEALKHLKEKELIETKGDHPYEAKTYVKKPAVDKRFGYALKRFFAAGFITTMFFFAFFVGAKTSLRQLRPQAAKFQNAFHEETLARHRMEEKLRWILEAYRVEHGSYPLTLSNLYESKLVTRKFIERLENFSFRYHLTPSGDTYTLL